MAREPVDRRVAALAKRQHGYVTRQQLLHLGLNRQAINRRIAAGRLIPVYAGVYAVGHLPTLHLDRAHSALLACGRHAVLSHRSAATVWGIFKDWRTPFDVTVPTARRRPGIVVHRAALDPRDVAHNRGIRVTSAARTVLDIAPRVTTTALRRAVDDLRRPGHIRLEQMDELLWRCPRHRGVKLIRPLVEASQGPTRSNFEVVFLDFVKRHGLPEPLVNAVIDGYEVDAFFPIQRVIVELDGWGFHSSRTSFARDRERDAHMLALDLPTVRITWERLTGKPAREARRLQAILARRSARAA